MSCGTTHGAVNSSPVSPTITSPLTKTMIDEAASFDEELSLASIVMAVASSDEGASPASVVWEESIGRSREALRGIMASDDKLSIFDSFSGKAMVASLHRRCSFVIGQS